AAVVDGRDDDDGVGGGDLCPDPCDALCQFFVGLLQHHGQGDLGEVDELYLDVWSRVGDAGDPARGHGPEPTLSHAADQDEEPQVVVVVGSGGGVGGVGECGRHRCLLGAEYRYVTICNVSSMWGSAPPPDRKSVG